MYQDSFKLKGTVRLVLTDADGNVKEDRTVENLVTTAGKGWITERMVGTVLGVMTHMGVGTSTQDPAAGDTALIAPHADGRQALTTSGGTQVTIDSTDDAVEYVATFAAGFSTGALTEAGIFTASTAGTMLCRTEFAVINKLAGDALTITWRVKAAAA